MYLKQYFASVAKEEQRSTEATAFFASLDAVHQKNPSIASSIIQELQSQRKQLKMIASENYASLAVQLACGNLLSDKYSEGNIGKRFYAGCEQVDLVEKEAKEKAEALFSAEHAYVQPHSGSDANLIAMWALLTKFVQTKELNLLHKQKLEDCTKEQQEKIRLQLVKQKMLALSLVSGGHLTHGFRHNISGKIFQTSFYDIDPQTNLLDYNRIEEIAKKEKPFLLVAGYSAYSRLIDFAKMREIADSVGAILFVDMAHFSGLVAGKVFTGKYNPIPYADILTTTTHKLLRGPRGGLILCKKDLAEFVNRGCPLVQGGPMPHIIGAKAVAFTEALSSEYKDYAKQVVVNAKALANTLLELGVEVLTKGTDNHLVLIDVHKSFHLTGKQAEKALLDCGVVANRNAIANREDGQTKQLYDLHGAWYTSGIRLGTPALTTLGMKESEMRLIGKWIYRILSQAKAEENERDRVCLAEAEQKKISEEVKQLLKSFPLYPELVVEQNALAL